MSITIVLTIATLIVFILTHSWLTLFILTMISFYTSRKNVILIATLSFLLITLQVLLTVYLNDNVPYTGYYDMLMRIVYVVWISFFLYFLYKNEKPRKIETLEAIMLGLLIGVSSGSFYMLLIGVVNGIVEMFTIGITSLLLANLILLGVVLFISKLLFKYTTEMQRRNIGLVLGLLVIGFNLLGIGLWAYEILRQ